MNKLKIDTGFDLAFGPGHRGRLIQDMFKGRYLVMKEVIDAVQIPFEAKKVEDTI